VDLGCGTGKLTEILAGRGYDMIGIDLSEDMLAIAQERKIKNGSNTLYSLQDMRDFELYGTVQAVFSSFDCLNYITDPDDLKQVFSLVHNYLEPGGIFIFDVNTEYRYREILDGKNFVFEFEDSMTVWRSFFSEEEKTCEFVLDTFAENEDGTYDRACEDQLQKLHTREEILEAAKGFSLVSVSGGKGFDGCTEREKEYYVFKRD
jgi:SAM-dependent methyltransferase